MITTWYKEYKIASRNMLNVLENYILNLVMPKIRVAAQRNQSSLGFILLPQDLQNIIQQAKNNFHNINEDLFTYNTPQIDFSIKFNKIEVSDDKKISINGSYFVKDRRIRIDAIINSLDPIRLLKEFDQQISEKMRHELEHTLQKNFITTHDKKVMFSDPDYSNAKNCIIEWYKYLTNNNEINAYIRGWKLESIKRRITINEIMEEKLWYKLFGSFSNSVKKDIENNTEDGIYYNSLYKNLIGIYIKRYNQIYNKKYHENIRTNQL